MRAVPVLRCFCSTLLMAVMVAGCEAAPTALPTSGPDTVSATPQAGNQSPSAGTDNDGHDPTQADLRALRDLMRTRATAIMSRDLSSFLATLTPGDKVLVRTQTTYFENLTGLDPVSVSFAVDDTWLPPARTTVKGPRLRPVVIERVQLPVVTTRPIGNPISLTFVRHQGSWLVGAERVSDDHYDYDSAQSRPWYGGLIDSSANDEVMALVDADGPVSAPTLLQGIEEALVHDRDVLDLSGKSPVLVDATSNNVGYVINAATNQESGAVAKRLYAADDTGRLTNLAGHVIQANPKYVEQLLYSVQTIRHELVHRLLAGVADWSPAWVREGVPEWVATRPDGRPFTVSQVDGPALLDRKPEIPIDGTFGANAAEDYLISLAAITYLARQGDVGDLKAFMKVYQDHWDGPNPDRVTPRALREVYGLTQAQLARGTWQVLAELLA